MSSVLCFGTTRSAWGRTEGLEKREEVAGQDGAIISEQFMPITLVLV